MNDLRDFFKLLRYLLIFLVVVVGVALFSKVHAAEDYYSECWIQPKDKASSLVLGIPEGSVSNKLINAPSSSCYSAFRSSIQDGYIFDGGSYNGNKTGYFVSNKNSIVGNGCVTESGRYICSSSVNATKGYLEAGVNWRVLTNVHIGHIRFFGKMTEPPKDPCETPKTDEQCKKGQRRQVTLPKSFWSQSTAEHKGCVISVESPGVGIANMGDDRATGHVNMMGSTGKSWCANTGTSDTTAQSIGASGEFTPTTTPKDCPKGSVTMGGQSWCYTGASDGVTKPDGSVPDDGIHDNGTSDDGNGGDVDSSIDREPGDGSGGDGGGGDTGGGGDGSGGGTGDGNGISKGDIKDGVKEGVEEALGKGSGAPAPMIPPSVEGVEGGINGVMSRYKQRINNAPISSAFNNISFSVPSAGCSPWGIHLDYLDVNLQFDQCAFLNSHSGMIGALMMAVFAGLSLVVFLKA